MVLPLLTPLPMASEAKSCPLLGAFSRWAHVPSPERQGGLHAPLPFFLTGIRRGSENSSSEGGALRRGPYRRAKVRLAHDNPAVHTFLLGSRQAWFSPWPPPRRGPAAWPAPHRGSSALSPYGNQWALALRVGP